MKTEWSVSRGIAQVDVTERNINTCPTHVRWQTAHFRHTEEHGRVAVAQHHTIPSKLYRHTQNDSYGHTRQRSPCGLRHWQLQEA